VPKVSYREGDWFVVPLRDGGFAAGVVARANSAGVLFGYFFGPRRAAVPTLPDLGGLRADQAVLAGKFGHMSLRNGTWRLLGRSSGWDREQWRIPALIRYEELTGRSFKVIYDDGDPNRVLREEQVSAGTSEQGPKDGLMGAGFVEVRLTSLLRA
jgi:hypothetical protein